MKKTTMVFKAGCLSLVCLSLAASSSAAMMELEWTLPGGKVERETRPLPEKDGVAVFSLSRDEIKSRGASSLALTPDFARARKGDDGFWVFSSGEFGTFRCDAGKAECNRWQLMSVYGLHRLAWADVRRTRN